MSKLMKGEVTAQWSSEGITKSMLLCLPEWKINFS
jgi:hypothetical protein